MTAAHCIRPRDRPTDLRVVMGSSKRARYFYYFFQVPTNKICPLYGRAVDPDSLNPDPDTDPGF